MIGGAAALATARPQLQNGCIEILSGVEYDDDSLVAAELNDALGTPKQQQSLLQSHANDDKKAPTVTVNEVAVTPHVAEMLGVTSLQGPKQHESQSRAIDNSYKLATKSATRIPAPAVRS